MSVVLTVAAVALLTSIYAVVTLLRENYPPPRTSARQRLLERNPALQMNGDVRWNVASRRVQLGAPTRFVVGLVMLLVTAQPIVTDDAANRF